MAREKFIGIICKRSGLLADWFLTLTRCQPPEKFSKEFYQNNQDQLYGISWEKESSQVESFNFHGHRLIQATPYSKGRTL
jgi:hypothetical protein